MRTMLAKAHSSARALSPAAMLGRRALQRKCACGGTPVLGGECESCRKKRPSRAPASLQPKLVINQPGDRFEEEADRMADSVMSGESAAAPATLSSVGAGAIQREDKTSPAPPKPDNYDDTLKKILDALAETPAAKELKAKATELGKDFLSSVEGKVVAGSALGGALAVIIATNSELPMQIPELPLDFIAPGLKAKLTYEGPVQKPSNISLQLTSKSGVSFVGGYSSTPAGPGKPAEQKAGLSITIPFGGSPAKKPSGPTDSEKYRAETARIAADQAKLSEAMKSPDEKKEDKAFWDSYWKSKVNDPLNPTAPRKKEDLFLMRKESNKSFDRMTAPSSVQATLSENGSPLDSAARALMESRFGHDFSQVRVHTDPAAAESARAVQARAYTVGNHMVFGAGEYQPHSIEGQRLLAHELTHTVQQAGGGTALQRYAVPASLACADLVDWLNNNSPYKPEWAETACTYSFSGGVNVSGSKQPDGTMKADVKGHDKLTVGVGCPIDRPTWSPSNRTGRAAEVAAWNSMRATLDAHESQHRQIGQTWRGTLEKRFRAVDFSVTGKDKAEAMANASAELQRQQQQWGADAQAAQDAIDPFRGAVLTCP